MKAYPTATAHSAELSEDNRFVHVKVIKGPMQHGRCCYHSGQCFTVPRHEGECYLDEDYRAEVPSCPFPSACADGDLGAKPMAAYRDAIVLAAGVPTEVCVPSDYSCQPAYVHFTSCGGCLWVNYGVDAVEPAAVPAADILDGSAPDMNPHTRTLADAMGEAITKMSLVSNTDTIVQLEYFGV